MFRSVTIRRSASELEAQEWRFTVVGDTQIVLDGYVELSKPTKRHKERVMRSYDRITPRDSTCLLDEVPFPEDVTREAYEKVIAQLRVVKKYER